jgi:hypothetical protein
MVPFGHTYKSKAVEIGVDINRFIMKFNKYQIPPNGEIIFIGVCATLNILVIE